MVFGVLFLSQLNADIIFFEKFLNIFFPEFFTAFIHGKTGLGNGGRTKDCIIFEQDIQKGCRSVRKIFQLFIGQRENKFDTFG